MDASRRPACDNCKERKTRCDRASPCSSCVAAELACNVTRRPAEKRQRILISARYDEAIEKIDRSLQDVSQALQKLLVSSERPQQPSPASTVNTTPASGFVNTPAPSTSDASLPEGYRGDSSFDAHVRRVTEALRDASMNLGVDISDPLFSTAAPDSTAHTAEPNLLETPPLSVSVPPPINVKYHELEGRALPPLEPVLKLLRLTQSENFRIFTDVPVIDGTTFGELCQKVYFAISDYSLPAWAIVNTGLYYLFLDLQEQHYTKLGVSVSDVQDFLKVLQDNIEAALGELRVLGEYSADNCRALALLAAYCNRTGRTSLAWALIVTASRVCIDLGWHRLPSAKSPEGAKLETERNLFWHIYVIEKGMAFTYGRTPAIQQYDVTTERTSVPVDQMGVGVHAYIYLAILESSIITGEMHVQLFSAAAQRAPQQTRINLAMAFARRLTDSHNDLKQKLGGEPPTDRRFKNARILIDMIMPCLLTIAYRIVPCEDPDAKPLQCNSECINAARQALSTLVAAYDVYGQYNMRPWASLLNGLFSLVPFACFVVLAGNTVVSLSTDDLSLLLAAVNAIQPVASSSVSRRKLVDVCRTFYQFASYSVARQRARGNGTAHCSTLPGRTLDCAGQVDIDVQSHGFENTMTPHDWDIVMDEFDLGIGVGAMASYVEPYMPFDGNLP